jgi:predicted RNA-binding Zn-ribbon protein involved in translation (DUF1610 family)
MKCPKCGWEGEESELVEETVDLKINDHFISAIFVMANKRSSFLCPICRTSLKVTKYMYGLEVESEDISK